LLDQNYSGVVFPVYHPSNSRSDFNGRPVECAPPQQFGNYCEFDGRNNQPFYQQQPKQHQHHNQHSNHSQPTYVPHQQQFFQNDFPEERRIRPATEGSSGHKVAFNLPPAQQQQQQPMRLPISTLTNKKQKDHQKQNVEKSKQHIIPDLQHQMVSQPHDQKHPLQPEHSQEHKQQHKRLPSDARFQKLPDMPQRAPVQQQDRDEFSKKIQEPQPMRVDQNVDLKKPQIAEKPQLATKQQPEQQPQKQPQQQPQHQPQKPQQTTHLPPQQIFHNGEQSLLNL